MEDPADHGRKPGPGGPPHDALFKQVLRRPERAAEELRWVLPPAIASALDWSTLRRLPVSLIDRRLAAAYADLLFSVQLCQRPALVYVLFEHKSSRSRRLPLQLLGYMLRIWEQHLRDPKGREARLPPILPVVVQHGRSRWVQPTDLLHLIDLPADLRGALLPFVPDFRFVLDDLGAVSEAEIEGRNLSALVRLTLLCLRSVGTEADVRAAIRRWAAVIRAVVSAPGGNQAVQPINSYIMQAGDLAAQELHHLLAAAVGPRAEDAMKSTYDQVLEKGIEKGIEKGQAQGRADMLLKQLTRRFGVLAPEVIARVRAARIAELDTWAERVLTAPALEDVLDS